MNIGELKRRLDEVSQQEHVTDVVVGDDAGNLNPMHITGVDVTTVLIEGSTPARVLVIEYDTDENTGQLQLGEQDV
jgi:hypothetical protein